MQHGGCEPFSTVSSGQYLPWNRSKGGSLFPFGQVPGGPGDVRTYRIHLGSENRLTEPNDRYLCIVPTQAANVSGKVFLPFEGDSTLAIILSKAFLLAEDRSIKDPTILHQIRT